MEKKKDARGRKELPPGEKKVSVRVMVKKKYSAKAKRQFEAIAKDLNLLS